MELFLCAIIFPTQLTARAVRVFDVYHDASRLQNEKQWKSPEWIIFPMDKVPCCFSFPLLVPVLRRTFPYYQPNVKRKLESFELCRIKFFIWILLLSIFSWFANLNCLLFIYHTGFSCRTKISSLHRLGKKYVLHGFWLCCSIPTWQIAWYLHTKKASEHMPIPVTECISSVGWVKLKCVNVEILMHPMSISQLAILQFCVSNWHDHRKTHVNSLQSCWMVFDRICRIIRKLRTTPNMFTTS